MKCLVYTEDNQRGVGRGGAGRRMDRALTEFGAGVVGSGSVGYIVILRTEGGHISYIDIAVVDMLLML